MLHVDQSDDAARVSQGAVTRADATVRTEMASDRASGPLLDLLERLAAPTDLPTTALGRLRRTASAGMKAGFGALSGRLLGADAGGTLGGLTPEAIASLAASLGELKGVAMKVGQILSYVDGSLTPESRELLSVLQVRSQPTPFDAIEQILRDDLGAHASELLRMMDRTPSAAASIGQVHRAVLPSGTQVAVKVRHPGIDAAIRADFKTAALGKVLARVIAPGVDVAEMMKEAEDRFLEECDYALEARRQALFAELYRGHTSITIPAVHLPWSSARVLTSTWQDGQDFETFLRSEPDMDTKERASRALYEFYVGTLYRHGVFNADPHPGNVLFARDGHVTILDHGCVREFDPSTVEALVHLSHAVRADEPSATQEALRDLGMPTPEKDYDVTRTMLRGFYAPLLEPGRHAILADGAVSIGQTVKLKKTVMRMRLPGRLLFLFRIRFGLYAVLARIGASLDWAALDDELATPAR
jgi:predicted unusual protein kinase regulating ubiquinone biosynthesis (AarF/ABC1/UbiB family)